MQDIKIPIPPIAVHILAAVRRDNQSEFSRLTRVELELKGCHLCTARLGKSNYGTLRVEAYLNPPELHLRAAYTPNNHATVL